MNPIDARVRLPQELRPNPRYQAPRQQTEQYDKVLGLTTKMNEGRLEKLLMAMDSLGIRKAVMHAESEGGEDADALNEALAQVLSEYPDRFKGIAYTDIATHRPTDMMRQVRRAARMGFVGVSLQPAFFGKNIDDRSLYPLYAHAEDEQLVVAVHTGINYSRLHPIRHERAELLDQVACDFPDLKIVACHAGWPFIPEYVAVARRHPTVYLEFGALAPRYVARAGTGWDVLFGMMPNLLREQILFASDWPMMEPRRALAEWRESGLNDQTLQALFHNNAANLFGFPGT